MPQRHPYPGQQFGYAERFGQIVVGARVQRLHLVGFLPARREDHHRHLRPLPHPGQNGQAVGVGQSQVQQDEIGGMAQDHRHPVSRGPSFGHLVPFVLESGPQEPPHGNVVFNDEDVESAAGRLAHSSSSKPLSSHTARSAGAGCSGNANAKTAPPPGRPAAQIRPP